MKENRGFTLAELLITVSVVGVLVLVSIAVFSGIDKSKKTTDIDSNLQNSDIERVDEIKKDEISIVNEIDEIKVGEQVSIMVETKSKEKVENYECQSSNNSVATVSGDTVLGVKEGTVIITVVTKDGLTATKEFKIISVPASEPEVVPAYIPEPEPTPTPEPEPTPTPEPTPAPESEPTPAPESEPTPTPEPEEESEPIMVGPEMMQTYN